MAKEEANMKESPDPSQPPFLEVLCSSCGKIRRFASGTNAGFAVYLINSKLGYGIPPALYIEAAKDGEEPISFGPNATLMNYGEGWKLQTAIEEVLKENYEAISLKQQISKQFSSLMRPLKRTESLLDIKQGHGETLRHFIIRFEREMLQIKDLEPAVAQIALTLGLLKGYFLYDIGLQQPKTLMELLELANKHIYAEEFNLAAPKQPAKEATRRPGRSRPETLQQVYRNDRHSPSYRQGSGRKKYSTRRFEPYQYPDLAPSWDESAISYPASPLNSSMEEEVVTIQNKDHFKHFPAQRNTYNRDMTKYCAYHVDHGHNTESCCQLRGLIEELIKAGKMKDFILATPADQTHRPEKEPAQNSAGPTPARAIHIAGYIP